jgi:hypothetical protein
MHFYPMDIKCHTDLILLTQNHCVYGLCPSSGIQNNYETQFSPKLDCFRPQVREELHLLC